MNELYHYTSYSASFFCIAYINKKYCKNKVIRCIWRESVFLRKGLCFMGG